jgi:radical SAM protein with 4Fe4S-binding SPASM domain
MQERMNKPMSKNGWDPIAKYDFGLCSEPARAITVGADGQVWACPYAYWEQADLSLGNLANDKLKTILKHKRFNILSVDNSLNKSCQECPGQC